MMTDIINTPTPHNYECLVCGHTSSVRRSFMAHMKTHEGRTNG